MRRHRFIVDFSLRKGSLPITDRELVHQWKNVLKLKIGEELVLCDGKGKEADGIIEALEKNTAKVALDEPQEVKNEPPHRITLFCSVLKRENFELVVQKCTELGVTEIVPVISHRTVKQNVHVERLQKIAKEAAEQSGRGTVPKISEPQALTQADLKRFDVSLFFTLLPKTARKGNADLKRDRKIAVFIGPEGGWDDHETAWATEHGCELITLGPLTLRAETAAVVACYETAYAS